MVTVMNNWIMNNENWRLLLDSAVQHVAITNPEFCCHFNCQKTCWISQTKYLCWNWLPFLTGFQAHWTWKCGLSYNMIGQTKYHESSLEPDNWHFWKKIPPQKNTRPVLQITYYGSKYYVTICYIIFYLVVLTQNQMTNKSSICHWSSFTVAIDVGVNTSILWETMSPTDYLQRTPPTFRGTVMWQEKDQVIY